MATENKTTRQAIFRWGKDQKINVCEILNPQ